MDIDALIVGAGVSGLYLGYILKKNGLKIRILEAGHRAGGRIHTVEGFEAGAQYIHGGHSVLKEMADYQAIKYRKETGNAYFWIDGKLLTRKQALLQADFEKVDDLLQNYEIKNLGEHPFKYRNILEGFASIYGTSLSRLKPLAVSQMQTLWHSGDTNFVLEDNYESILKPLTEELSDCLSFDCAVSQITMADGNCQVLTRQGQIYNASKVAVCVPLGVLKAKAIEFAPSLPHDKLEAIAQLGFDAGAKVFLEFKQPFWPQDLSEIYGGGHCPLYAIDRKTTIMAYLVGRYAAQVLGYGKQGAIEKLLAELDEIFEPTRPSQFFIKAHLFDWGSNEWTRGAYSFPVENGHIFAQYLAQPINRTLYFAGEHTHFEGHQGTVHGAMESAEYCAKLIIESTQSSF